MASLKRPAPIEAPPGKSRILIDSDIPASVEIILAETDGVTNTSSTVYTARGSGTAYSSHSSHFESTQKLCVRTPCYAILDGGQYDLRLTSLTDEGRRSRTILSIGAKNRVLQHNLGWDEQASEIGRVLTVTGVGLGLGAAITGGLLYGLSFLDEDDEYAKASNEKIRSPGAILLASGGAILLITLIASIASASKKQAGASLEYDDEALPSYPNARTDRQVIRVH